MRINRKLRLQNKHTLTALMGVTVAFVYQIMGVFNVVAPVSENDVINFIGIVLNLLAGWGVIIDPTTKGASDSNRAMQYEIPNPSEDPEDDEVLPQ